MLKSDNHFNIKLYIMLDKNVEKRDVFKILNLIKFLTFLPSLNYSVVDI